MLGITDIGTYVIGTAAIILLPGPNSIFVLSTAARWGVRTGYQAATGVFLGDTVLMVFSAAGVASLLTAYPPIFIVIKYAGAGYLGYVGLTMLRGAWLRWRHRADENVPPRLVDTIEPAAPRRPFRRAAVISLLNPKAILFFVSFFIQFVDPAYPHPALSFLLLGLIAQVFSVAYLTILILAGTYLAIQFRQRHRLAAGVSTGIGALFLGFGIKLATASSA